MHTKTIAELAAGLKAGEFTSEELTRAFIERIKAHDGQLNSYITVTEEQALAAERQRASELAQKADNLKDLISTLEKGIRRPERAVM